MTQRSFSSLTLRCGAYHRTRLDSLRLCAPHPAKSITQTDDFVTHKRAPRVTKIDYRKGFPSSYTTSARHHPPHPPSSAKTAQRLF